MIALLRGVVVSRESDHVVLDVGGVGYRVFMPDPDIGGLPGAEEVRVFIHTSVREDAMHLFGFREPRAREIFRALLTVSGIGPRLALTILGAAGADGIVAAVQSGQIGALTHIKGIGKKTAQRILIELKEAFLALAPASTAGPAPPRGRPALLGDVQSALLNLGFKTAQVERAVAELAEVPDAPVDFDGLLREALQRLR